MKLRDKETISSISQKSLSIKRSYLQNCRWVKCNVSELAERSQVVLPVDGRRANPANRSGDNNTLEGIIRETVRRFSRFVASSLS
jgi:hypothetical protein